MQLDITILADYHILYLTFLSAQVPSLFITILLLAYLPVLVILFLFKQPFLKYLLNFVVLEPKLAFLRRGANIKIHRSKFFSVKY